jgi:hypothetical protein
MNKKGQFFLIAALVIIGVVAGLTAVYNQARISVEYTAVYDLTNQINFEGSQVVAHGVLNGDVDDILERLEELIAFYSETNPDSDFIAIYGNGEKLWFIVYAGVDTGGVNIEFGDSSLEVSDPTPVSPETFGPYNYPSQSGLITVELGGEEYEFDVEPGQTFYIIVRTEREGEEYVGGSEENRRRGRDQINPPQNPDECDENHLSLCLDPDSCEDEDGYWYNDKCNEEERECEEYSDNGECEDDSLQ